MWVEETSQFCDASTNKALKICMNYIWMTDVSGEKRENKDLISLWVEQHQGLILLAESNGFLMASLILTQI